MTGSKVEIAQWSKAAYVIGARKQCRKRVTWQKGPDVDLKEMSS